MDLNTILETAVLTPQASSGQKSPPNLRLIGAEDAARLAMCSADDSDAAPGSAGDPLRGLSGHRLARHWPMGAAIALAAALAWMIG